MINEILGTIILALLMLTGGLALRVFYLQDLICNHEKDYHCLLTKRDR